jgi:hypothetical protein
VEYQLGGEYFDLLENITRVAEQEEQKMYTQEGTHA